MPVSRKNQNLPKLWQSIKPQQSFRQFENSIIQFHHAHRTSIRQLPYVLGKKINLRKLYISVIKRGGYKKVNENSEWEEVLDDLNLPKETTNCELAIQSIYHRYLEEYEREQWNALSSVSYSDSFSNNNDSNSMDIDLSKHSSYISELALRDKSFLAAFVNDNTPKVYCDYQHIFPSSARSESGLSSDLKDLNEFNHLKMSMLSGLTNEIEFALNTILIMSNSNQIRFDLRFTGNLLDIMLATVGVFDTATGSYYEQFKNCNWMNDCLQFWNHKVEEGVGRMFLIPNVFSISKKEIKNLLKTSNISSNPDSNQLFNNDNRYHQITDTCAQRIHLVATVLYNLTSDSLANARSTINNLQFLRFLFLSVHSTDPVLRRLCLQTLSKLRLVLYPVASSMSLQRSLLPPVEDSVDLDRFQDEDDTDDEWFSQFLLEFLHSLLSSENRCDRITALEMVQTLCLIEENHQVLNKSFQISFVSTISSQLLVPDIHPLCCALESLVSLSQLGEDMCRRMAMCQALLKILLQFIQIEAQMFGPSAVYKIKTFNHRPPVQMPVYNSLPQIMRFPSNNTLRPPFINPLPSLTPNLVEQNIQIECSGNITLPIVSVANFNSISTHGLSNYPAPHLVKSSGTMVPQPPPHMINNNPAIHQLPNPSQSQYRPASQMTPLQQIDQLLTKSIASFENPITKKDDVDVQPERELIRKQCDKVAAEKRVVKIKCGIDGPDCEIGDINGTKCDRDQNGDGVAPIVNGNDIVTNQSINGGLDKPKSTDLSTLSPDKHRIYMNGSLEIDATNVDDPDRRQMPPPSLPTPSMLKKQMRPKLSPPSQVGVANGYLQQLNSKVKRKLVSEMTLTTNAQIEDRCDRAKAWLRQQYRLSDDTKSFVLKQDLVNELHEFLFEDDNEAHQTPSHRRIFSAHELHSCIKDVFGTKVQVKVEHRINGKSQLIYSNLCRIEDEDNDKLLPNGIVNSVLEMNGFIHNSTGKKKAKINHTDENPIDNGTDSKKQITKKSNNETTKVNLKKTNLSVKRMRKRTYWYRKRVRKVVPKTKHKTSLSDQKPNSDNQMKPEKDNSQSSFDNESSSTVSPSSVLSQSLLESQPQSNTNETNNYHFNENYLPVFCLWGSCTERFSDENALNSHLTKEHIPMSADCNRSPTRTNCQWQHCLTASIPRAPLSLLSHIIQEHLNKTNFAAFPPTQNMTARIAPNPIPYNIASPPSINPTINPSINHFNQIPEKSGWSVLYDHFRLDEQMQPHLPEGPITKHIRISSSIILRNMSRHSIITKEFLKNNETLLSTVAMSSQDCAPIIVQCLDELSLPTTS